MTDFSRNNKRVLVICYHQPPLGGIPVMRSLRLAKYLPKFGWHPTVFTSRNGFDSMHGLDSSLLKKLPDDLELVRVHDPVGRLLNWLQKRLSDKLMYQVDRLTKLFCFPDEKLIWGVKTYIKARKLVRTQRVLDVIYATGFPWTSLLVGMWLKLAFKKPLVVDLRDSWSLSPMPVWNRFKLHGILERKIMQAADCVIFTSEGTKGEYQKLYPNIAEKMKCIHNGFDPEDFGLMSDVSSKPKTADGKFKLIYAGSLSDVVPPKARTRSLIPVLEALQMFKKRNPGDYQKLEFTVYSNQLENTKRVAQELGVSDIVTFLPRLPHNQIIRKLEEADVPVLIVRKSKDAQQIAPAKLYEYIAVGKPILTISPSFSEAARIVKRYDLGKVVTYDEVPEGIVSAISEFQSNGWEKANGDLDTAWNAFNGIKLVENFSGIFTDLVKEKNVATAAP